MHVIYMYRKTNDDDFRKNECFIQDKKLYEVKMSVTRWPTLFLIEAVICLDIG